MKNLLLGLGILAMASSAMASETTCISASSPGLVRAVQWDAAKKTAVFKSNAGKVFVGTVTAIRPYGKDIATNMEFEYSTDTKKNQIAEVFVYQVDKKDWRQYLSDTFTGYRLVANSYSEYNGKRILDSSDGNIATSCETF